MIQINDKVLAIINRDDAIQAGTVYKVESIEHPSLGKCGLIKLYGVRDYWNINNFVKITNDMLSDLPL